MSYIHKAVLYCFRAPTAVKAAATCYIELIVKESDNNVKLIVLDRLVSMAETHDKVGLVQDTSSYNIWLIVII